MIGVTAGKQYTCVLSLSCLAACFQPVPCLHSSLLGSSALQPGMPWCQSHWRRGHSAPLAMGASALLSAEFFLKLFSFGSQGIKLWVWVYTRSIKVCSKILAFKSLLLVGAHDNRTTGLGILCQLSVCAAKFLCSSYLTSLKTGKKIHPVMQLTS